VAPAASPPEAAALSVRHDLQGRVLYVEDDPVNQILMESYLGLRPGVALTLAGDGASALETACRELPDLVIVDMMLPDMHGCDIARALTERLGAACPPMVAFSANALSNDIAEAMKAGFRSYLIKPAATHQVLAIVDEVLATRRELAPAEDTARPGPA
jgi:CheY-like chemotaxis protein